MANWLLADKFARLAFDRAKPANEGKLRFPECSTAVQSEAKQSGKLAACMVWRKQRSTVKQKREVKGL